MTDIATSESIDIRRKSARKIITILKKTYPNAKIALRYHNFWELLVATILSAQCTDKTVNIVTERLFRKYPHFQDYLQADQESFARDIKSTGFYKNKAKNILAAAKVVNDRFHGRIPKTMAEMIEIPGVARKTANVVLGNAYSVVEGIAVDTHVQRISQRLRLVDLSKVGGKKEIFFRKGDRKIVDYKKDGDPVKIERELMALLPKQEWFAFTYLIIEHGRAICKAQNPNCQLCPLQAYCPASRV